MAIKTQLHHIKVLFDTTCKLVRNKGIDLDELPLYHEPQSAKRLDSSRGFTRGETSSIGTSIQKRTAGQAQLSKEDIEKQKKALYKLKELIDLFDTQVKKGFDP